MLPKADRTMAIALESLVEDAIDEVVISAL